MKERLEEGKKDDRINYAKMRVCFYVCGEGGWGLYITFCSELKTTFWTLIYVLFYIFINILKIELFLIEIIIIPL